MGAALDERFQVSGGDLLAWRHHQLQQGGEAADFDWLLDLAGGLSWSQLQALRLDPQRPVQLLQPLDQLARLWHRHRQLQEPLQYLVGRCPWRGCPLQRCAGPIWARGPAAWR